MAFKRLFEIAMEAAESGDNETKEAAFDTLRHKLTKMIQNNDLGDLPSSLQSPNKLHDFMIQIGFTAGKAASLLKMMTDETIDPGMAKAYNRYSILYFQGPPGSGKNHTARKMHEMVNPGQPFIEINIGTLDENLIASELFGHEKGAFTGADRETQGAFVDAGEGTIFLDEIQDLPKSMQGKLNTVLESKMVRKVGSSESVPVEAKVIIASNVDLEDMVEAGEFRLDLYSRITSGYKKSFGTTKERPEELEQVVSDTLVALNNKEGEDIYINEHALAMLENLDLKANFRDLKSIVTNAFYKVMDELAEGREENEIMTTDLEHGSISEESMKDALSAHFDYDDDTMSYLAKTMKKMGAAPDQVDELKDKFPFNVLLIKRLIDVYKKLGGKNATAVEKWLMSGGAGAVRQYVKSYEDLSDRTLRGIWDQVLEVHTIPGEDVAAGIDSIVESTDDDMESLLPGERTNKDVDPRIMEVMDNTIMMADEDVLNISSNM
jgi:hypothetical protein